MASMQHWATFRFAKKRMPRSSDAIASCTRLSRQWAFHINPHLSEVKKSKQKNLHHLIIFIKNSGLCQHMWTITVQLIRFWSAECIYILVQQVLPTFRTSQSPPLWKVSINRLCNGVTMAQYRLGGSEKSDWVGFVICSMISQNNTFETIDMPNIIHGFAHHYVTFWRPDL